MSNKIKFDHNIKKIKEQRKFKKLLQLEKDGLDLNYLTSNYGKQNKYF